MSYLQELLNCKLGVRKGGGAGTLPWEYPKYNINSKDLTFQHDGKIDQSINKNKIIYVI